MRYPTLTEPNTSRELVDVFGGLNHNQRIADGEFFDMKNLTSAYYPMLSPRGKRGVYASPTNGAKGIIAKDTLCYVDGGSFVMDGLPIDIGLSTEAADNPKTLVSMGAYVIILPDKKYINTADTTDYGNIEAEVTTTSTVTFTLCRVDGSTISPEYVQSAAPTEPTNGSMWVDTSTTPHALKQYASSTGMWVSVATTYIKIGSAGIGASFRQYDGVDISGLAGVSLLDSTTGSEILDAQLAELNGSFVVWERADDYIIVVGILDTTRSISNAVTVSRKMPVMDFVVENNNRLWGCRYGEAADGAVVNEIYASKLGDFRNWRCYMGTAMDSYTVSLGSDGRFTGAVSHLGYPIFFKENCLHKVYGTMPSNYQMQTTECRGVQRGCERSLAIVNEVLYYKSRRAVCAYDGSLPSEISSALGDVAYSDAVAGVHGNKYYVSMKDSADVYHLLAFDTVRGVWHMEDGVHADAFCSCGEELYFIDHTGGVIRTMFGSGTKDTARVEWFAETGVLGINSPDKKYITRLTVRLSMDIGTRVTFLAQYDSGGAWEHLATMTGDTLRSFSVPLRPRRCDHMRLRIEGEGEAKVYSIAKIVEVGSDL